VVKLLNITLSNKNPLDLYLYHKRIISDIVITPTTFIAVSHTQARLLTQTDVVKFLYEKDITNPFRVQTVQELNLLHWGSKVAKVDHSATALTGFRYIYREQVGAIAVTDNDGKIVGTLSASDVRFLSESHLQDLFLPVLEFLAKYGLSNRTTIHVTTASTLEETMKVILEGKVHRAWVCDKAMKVTGVITMSDIIRLWYK